MIAMSQELDENKQTLVFKALSDPLRVKIVKYLKCHEEVPCGEVGRKLGISKTSGSYHFKLLQEAGLINARKESREKYVSINYETFEQYVTNFISKR